MPLDFCIGTRRVIAVAATRLRKRTLAMLAASMSSLWMLSNGSRRGIPATPITTSAVKTTTTAALAVQSSQRLTGHTSPVGSIGFIEFDIRHRLYLVLSSSAKLIRQALEICPRSPPKQDRSLVNGFKVQINRLSREFRY